MEHNFTFKRFLNALLAFLVVNILAGLFILPWSVWVATTVRLGKLFEGHGIMISLRKSEAVVLNWLRMFFDGLIFISYVVGFLIALYGLFDDGFLTFFTVILISYIAPFVLSLVKEVLVVLPFGKYLKLEEIAENTQKQ